MVYLYFVGFLLGGTVVILVMLSMLRSSRRKGIPVVLLVTSTGDTQAFLWAQRLSISGIWYEPKDVSRIPSYVTGQRPQNWQIWVRAEDERVAREALGINSGAPPGEIWLWSRD